MFGLGIGMLALAIYLIIVGLQILAAVAVPPIVTGILALVAGICLLIRR